MRKEIYLLLIPVFYILIIIISRNPLITDDVTPSSSCDNLLEKSDILYIIPMQEELTVGWCNNIKSLNKTIGMHGITHEYLEFFKPIEENKLKEAIHAFEQCFGYKPKLFRPPYNSIKKENKRMIEKYNMTIYRKPYFLHPYCHCNPKPLMKPFNYFIFC